jgi:hypothetical protein
MLPAVAAVQSGVHVFPVALAEQPPYYLGGVTMMRLRGGEMPDLSRFAAIRAADSGCPRLPWTGTM